jgi:hypothetical protein
VHSFLAHNEYVRYIVPKERLLEYKIMRAGTHRAGKEVPEEAFPRIDEGDKRPRY